MDDETELARYGFSTYKNYLLGLSYFMDLEYPDDRNIYSSIPSLLSIRNMDTSHIRRLLFNCWSSETLLNLPRFLDVDFIKFSNHWSPVQSYYAMYLAVRALIVSRNISARGDHTTTLNVCVSNFINNQRIFPGPWSYLNGLGGNDLNFPDDFTKLDLSIQQNPYFFRTDRNLLLSNYSLFLKTTRDRLFEEKIEIWKSNNPTHHGQRLRLPPGKRKEIDQSTRATSFLDCFYRLRTRSNYRDVDIFILGSGQQEARNYLDALCNITHKTLVMLESHLCSSIGKDQFILIIT